MFHQGPITEAFSNLVCTWWWAVGRDNHGAEGKNSTSNYRAFIVFIWFISARPSLGSVLEITSSKTFWSIYVYLCQNVLDKKG